MELTYSNLKQCKRRRKKGREKGSRDSEKGSKIKEKIKKRVGINLLCVSIIMWEQSKIMNLSKQRKMEKGRALSLCVCLSLVCSITKSSFILLFTPPIHRIRKKKRKKKKRKREWKKEWRKQREENLNNHAHIIFLIRSLSLSLLPLCFSTLADPLFCNYCLALFSHVVQTIYRLIFVIRFEHDEVQCIFSSLTKHLSHHPILKLYFCEISSGFHDSDVFWRFIRAFKPQPNILHPFLRWISSGFCLFWHSQSFGSLTKWENLFLHIISPNFIIIQM